MLGVRLICVGKLGEKFWAQAVKEYEKRLGAYCKLEIIELPEERLPEDPSPAQIEAALSKEADAVRAKLPNGCLVIAMCVEGRERSSEEAASRSAVVHVPHDLSPPPAAGNAFGADLPGLPDQRRKQIP